LKRRVTSLPPISSEVFTEKVIQAQASSSAAATKAAFEKLCTVCARTYFSENAYVNHLGSQKHKARVAAAGNKRADDEASSMIGSTFSLGEPTKTKKVIDSDVEDNFNEVVEGIKNTHFEAASSASGKPVDAEGEVDNEVEESDEDSGSTASRTGDGEPRKVSLTRCLFCNYDSISVPQNALHMERIHGMFIPEKGYLVDLEGLIASLNEKIYDFHECLHCGKLKPTVFGLQTHMRDKGHCRIPFFTEEEQLEIGEFYDFRSTYSDVEDSDSEDALPGKSPVGGVKLGAKRHAKTDKDGDDEMEDGDGWETDSSESSLDSADLTAVPLEERTHSYEKLHQHPHHSHTDPRPHHNKDGWHSHAHKHNHAAFYTDYELHLPSGRTAGHRSLNKYYRQNLHSHPSPAERQQRAIEEAGASSDSEDGDDNEERNALRLARERGRALTSRANGGLGMLGVTAEKKRAVAVAEKRSRKVEERERRKFQWGNNKQSNFQKHFRVSLFNSSIMLILLIFGRIRCSSDFGSIALICITQRVSIKLITAH
jgi:pre-60S factor REI1